MYLHSVFLSFCLPETDIGELYFYKRYKKYMCLLISKIIEDYAEYGNHDTHCITKCRQPNNIIHCLPRNKCRKVAR